MNPAPRTRAEYLTQGYDDSLAITEKLLDWRIAAVWFLISGIVALTSSAWWGGFAILPEAIGLTIFALIRSRLAGKRYARLRAILAEGASVPANPDATSFLPIYRITPLDAVDLDALDRRLRMRGQDRIDAARNSRRAQSGALAFVIVAALAVVGLLIGVLFVVTAKADAISIDQIGALIILGAIFAPGLLAFREISVFLDWTAEEAQTTLADAEVRLEQLRSTGPDFSTGQVIIRSSSGYAIDPARMLPKPSRRRIQSILRPVLLWVLLALFVLFVADWLVLSFTTNLATPI